MKTVSIIGNRPQLMKVIPELADVLIWTGQHYDKVLKNAYTEQRDRCGKFVELGVTTIEEMAKEIESIIAPMMGAESSFVTVYGDTSSTLAGALAGSRWTSVVHVEAGLRCGNESLPEERNRIVVDALCDFAFPTTNEAMRNIPKHKLESALVVGDIMQERLWEIWQTTMRRQIPTNKNDKWICTIHRAENSAPETMMGLIKNINTFVKRPRIYLHPKGEHLFRDFEKDRLPAIENAVTYYEMLRQLWNCEGVITDSGGLLREAAWLGKPCIVLRDECEFPELVEAKRVKLVGRSEEALRDALEANDWGCKVELNNPGTTQKILDHLGIKRRFFGPKEVEIEQDITEEKVEVLCR